MGISIYRKDACVSANTDAEIRPRSLSGAVPQALLFFYARQRGLLREGLRQHCPGTFPLRRSTEYRHGSHPFRCVPTNTAAMVPLSVLGRRSERRDRIHHLQRSSSLGQTPCASWPLTSQQRWRKSLFTPDHQTPSGTPPRGHW